MDPHDDSFEIDPGTGGGKGRERSERPFPEPGPGSAPNPRRPRRKFSAEEKAALVHAWAASGENATVFAERHDLQGAQLYQWRMAMQGRTQRRIRRRKGKPLAPPPRIHTPEEKRAALEAFAEEDVPQTTFAKLWGITTRTLQGWLALYRKDGPKGLEPRPRGRPLGSGKKIPAPAVQEAILATKRRFPWFGARRIRDQIRRDEGLPVTAKTVSEVISAEAPELLIPAPLPKRTKPKSVRRFERARPNELWQSDITSFVLARHRQPVYLTVMLDDHSRFIVSYVLAMHQKADLVIEALRSGIAKYGKPKEVLTDQGRQYYAWRGKAAFQRILHQEAIAHVVSRAHHPETLGKCERLWETIDREFWQRCHPEDLDDARRRLALFISHYNFHRPHQGLGGLVPADRFFGAAEASRAAIESQVAANALRLAIGEAPRRPVYLYGQIGEKRVSLHGEKGRLIVDAGDGSPHTLGLGDFGSGAMTQEMNSGSTGPQCGQAGSDDHGDPAPGGCRA